MLPFTFRLSTVMIISTPNSIGWIREACFYFTIPIILKAKVSLLTHANSNIGFR